MSTKITEEGLLYTISKGVSLLCRDALNLGLFILVRWLNKQLQKHQQQYVERLPGVEQQLNRLLHKGKLLEQLQDQFRQLNENMNDEIQLSAVLNYLPDLAPQQDNLNLLIDEMRLYVNNDRLTVAALGTQDRVNFGILQGNIATLITEMQPQLDDLKEIAINKYATIRQLYGTAGPQQMALSEHYFHHLLETCILKDCRFKHK